MDKEAPCLPRVTLEGLCLYWLDLEYAYMTCVSWNTARMLQGSFDALQAFTGGSIAFVPLMLKAHHEKTGQYFNLLSHFVVDTRAKALALGEQFGGMRQRIQALEAGRPLRPEDQWLTEDGRRQLPEYGQTENGEPRDALVQRAASVGWSATQLGELLAEHGRDTVEDMLRTDETNGWSNNGPPPQRLVPEDEETVHQREVEEEAIRQREAKELDREVVTDQGELEV